MSIEKRAHARIAAPINARVVIGSEEHELIVRDLSIGGIFLYTKTAPGQVGAPITLKLAITAGIKPLVVKGEIVRILATPEENSTTVLGIGVEFVRSPAQDQALLELIDRAMLGRGTQNRAFPRVSYLLDVCCRTKQELKGLLRDIGEGGAALTLDRPMTKDEEVIVEVSRLRKVGSLKLAGWVVNSTPSPGAPGMHHVGVRFGKLSPDTLGELKAFIASLIRR